jgi:hypothetical protein
MNDPVLSTFPENPSVAAVNPMSNTQVPEVPKVPEVSDVIGMDLSASLGTYKTNIIALTSTVTGVAITSDVKGTFNATTKEYYAVQLENVANFDLLNTSASSSEIDVGATVNKISSNGGKKIAVTDDVGKKTNANICRYIRQAIFPDGTIKPDRTVLNTLDNDIGALTGMSGFKFANKAVGSTQILFGYEKTGEIVSGQGRVQYVPSKSKVGGTIISGSFKIENNNIVLSKDLGIQNKIILEKLLGQKLTMIVPPVDTKVAVVKNNDEEEEDPEFMKAVSETGQSDQTDQTGQSGGKRKTKKRKSKSVRFKVKKHRKTAKKHRKSNKKYHKKK